ncbi:MAG TPA: CHASE sensor domain-containing protein [Rhizomicrobium sp.]
MSSPGAPRMVRLPRFAMLIAASLLLLLGVAIAVFEDRFAARQHRQEITEQADILAASVTAAVSFDDRSAARDYLRALMVNPEIRAAAVYNDRGNLLAALRMRADALTPPRNAVSLPDYRWSMETIRLAEPVRQKGVQIGSIYLSAATESLQIRAARFVGIILLGAMGALVLAVFAAGQRALTKANTELRQRAGDLALANDLLQREMDERRQAEVALLQSQKLEAIGQLSGSIAHDLNNFFAVIKGNLQLLRRRLAEGRTDVQTYVDSAEQGLDKSTGLTRRILAFARRQPLLTEPVNLRDVVEDMLDLIRRSAGDKIAVETRLNSQWLTQCDPNQMETILLNLAINARDAMPHGGNLLIETRDLRLPPSHSGDMLSPGDYVELSMRDTGTGMSEEISHKALEPFFTTKPPGLGTGLGLSTAFSYIRQSGGRLSIQSGVDAGTAIIILLPRLTAQDSTDQPQAAIG